MTNPFWAGEFPAAITVCDPEGVILEMNDRAAKTFQDQGGRALIGTNMLDCHPDRRARSSDNFWMRAG
jgi:hypothetical protein